MIQITSIVDTVITAPMTKLEFAGWAIAVVITIYIFW